MQSKKNKIEAIYRFCKVNCSELERWTSYFHRRSLEMQSYVELMPETKDLSVLELGCGIGYQSAMLASISKSVVATDYPMKVLLIMHRGWMPLPNCFSN